MYENFISEFQANSLKPIELKTDKKIDVYFAMASGAREFLYNYSGLSFKKGLYRVHTVSDIPKWTQIVELAFPKFKNKIICFSYDWLGRHFALYFQGKNEPTILMFEPGTGEALNIPVSFLNFHEDELVNYQDAALAVDFFNSWRCFSSEPITTEKCVGYKVPLFLGGEDSINNLEISDLDVYWHISGQLINKVF